MSRYREEMGADLSGGLVVLPEAGPGPAPLSRYRREMSAPLPGLAVSDATLQANPDLAARALRVAESLGVSGELVNRDVATWERVARAREIERQAGPATRALLADPDLGPAAHDDVEALSGLEWLLGRWEFQSRPSGGEDAPTRYELRQVQPGAPQRAFGAGVEQARLADIGYRQLRGETVTPEDAAWADQLEALPSTQYGAESWLGKGAVEASRMLPYMLASLTAGTRTGIKAATAAGTVAAAMPQLPGAQALTVPAAAAAAFTAGTAAGAFDTTRRLEAGLAYREFRALPGIDDGAARLAAELAGNVNGLLEVVGLQALAATIPGVRQLAGQSGRAAVRRLLTVPTVRQALAEAAKGYAKAGATEVTTEILQEVTTITAGALAQGTPEEIASAETLGRLAEVATATAQAMTVMGVPGAGATVLGGAARAREAERSRAFVEALGGAAGASKLRERLPERFAALVDRMQEANGGPIQDVYLPAEQVVTLFQGDPREFLQGLPAEVVAQWDEALATGGDLRLTVGQFAAHVAATKVFPALADHVRWGSPEAMTAAEGRAFVARLGDELQAEHARSLAATEDLRDDPADPIAAEVSRQLAAAGRAPEVAQREARLLGVVFRTLGRRAGVDPQALFDRWNLRVRGTLPETVERARVDARLDPLIDRLRARLEGKEPTAEGQGLLAFLVAQGGVRDVGGGLAAMDAGRSRPGLLRKPDAAGGLDLDAAGLAAKEAGYFAERPTPDELLEAIRAGLAGQERLPLELEEKRGAREAWVDELAGLLDELGVDVRGASNEEIKAALEGVRASEPGDILAAEEVLYGYDDAPEADPSTVSDGAPPGPAEPGRAGDGADVQREAGAAPAGVSDQLELFTAPEVLPAEPEASAAQVRANFAIHVEPRDVGTLKVPAAVRTPHHAAAALRPFADRAQETYLALVVDAAGKPLAVLRTAIGTGSAALVDPLALGSALAIPGAARLYLAHNHPSAEVAPSREDLALADRLERVFQGSGLTLGAHLILGSNDWGWYQANGSLVQNPYPEPGRQRTVPVQEREVVFRSPETGTPIRDAAGARAALAGKGPGVLLLNTKNRPLGFVGLAPEEMHQLRGGPEGGLARLLRAAAESNANAAIIHYPPGDTAARLNLGTALQGPPQARNNLGIRVLDAIDFNGESATDEGQALSVGVEFRQSDQRTAADIQTDYDRARAEFERLLNDSKASAEDMRRVLREYAKGPWRQEFYQDQPAAPRASISFGDETTINLFAKADLSSFLHEGAHLFMRQLQELAKMEGAPEQIARDWAALQAFTADHADEVAKQEVLARAFEAYLREGKAPSEELAGLFQRFRGWLLAVYRTLKGLDVELTPEVRGVFDRLLATDEEIAAQEAKHRYDELPGAGELLTPEELAAYRRQRAAATEAATRRLEEAKIKERLREATAEWREERDRLTAEITAMVNRRPVYQAIHWLTRGERLGGDEAGLGPAILPEHRRLDVDVLRETYGPEILNYLNKAGVGLYGKDGVHPDALAPLFGFGSGDEMVQAILNAAPRKATIQAMVVDEMRERHGDLEARKDDAATAALEAVHGDERALVLATELAVLARRAGQKAPAAAVLRAAAGRIILGKLAKDAVAVGRYATAELRAARAAEQALAAGDLAEAAEQKRRQLLNHYLVGEAAAARDEVRQAEKRIGAAKKQASLDRLDDEAKRQVLSILERIGVRTGVERAQYEADRQELALWAQQQADDGVDVYVHDWLRKERNALAEGQTWRRDLTLEVLIGVKDTLASIAKHAKKGRTLYRTGENLDAAATRLAAVIAKNSPGGRGGDNLTPSALDRLAEGLGELEASATRMEFLFRRLDGGAVSGEVAQALFEPFAAAENRKVELLAAAGKDLHALFQRHYGRTVRELRSRRKWNAALERNVSKADLLALALNWGNEENRLAVVKGLRHLAPVDAADQAEALSAAAARVEAALGELTANDWAFVQAVWDFLDGYWPEIRQLQVDIVGVAPKKVTAAPVVVGGKTVALGGYYPLKYDRRTSEKAERYAEKGDVARLFENNFTRAATAHGHTKERVGSGGQPVRLDLGVIAEHLDQVIHDLTHRKPVIDADRLLNRPEVQEAIIDAVGRPMYRQLRPWLHALANPDREAVTGWERLLFRARHGTTVAMLGLAASTAVQQLGSWPVAIQALGPRWAAAGLASFLGDAARMGRQTRFAVASSGQLRHRMTTFDRDVRDFTKRLGPTGAFPEVHRFFFLLTGLMDMAVAVPTWLGAYQRGLAERGGRHDEAVAYADSMVRTTQGSGGVKDLAQLQRKEWLKLFTSFYSYFSNLANMMLEQVHESRRKGIVKSLPQLAAFFLFSLSAPALVSELLAGRGPDEDDEEEWPEWALKTVGLYAVATVPLFRDVVRYAVDGRGRFDMAPAQRAFEAPAQLLKGLPEAWEEGPDRWWAKNLVDTAGYWGALPSRQLWITGSALYDWLQGDDVAPSEFILRRQPR